MDQSVQFQYTALKDLLHELLTVIVGVLVFSIAFAEKIVDFRSARRWVQGALVSAWFFLVAGAAVCCFAFAELVDSLGIIPDASIEEFDKYTTVLRWELATAMICLIYALAMIAFTASLTLRVQRQTSASRGNGKAVVTGSMQPGEGDTDAGDQ